MNVVRLLRFAPRPAPSIAALAALLVVFGACLIIGAEGAAAKPPPVRSGSSGVGRAHAVVPVLAEAGGAVLRERQRGARVRIFALGGQGGRRRLVGRGRTGSAGVALVRLRTLRAPREMAVVVGGGRLLGKRFGGHMVARVRHGGRRPVFVSPVSSLAAAVLAAHPRLSPRAAERRLRRGVGLPRFFDFSSDLASLGLFNGRAFVRRARRAGGFDRFVRRRARRLSHAHAGSSAAEEPGCFAQAAETTAGFAELMGFRAVPGAPALPACAAARRSASSTVARASGDSPLSIFGTVLSVAGFVYGVASGQSTGAELAEIKAQLNEVQAELQLIQADLGELQAEVADVNANVVSGDETALIGDAVPTVNRIKVAGDEVMVLLGAASQILCEGSDGCHVPVDSGNLSKALAVSCEVETQACDDFYTELYFTKRALTGFKPRIAVENIGAWAEGSAFSGGAPDPGIVQYALDQGAGSEQFFQTGDASDARLQWSYYTIYSAYAQMAYATALSMGLGQTLPHATSAHPPKLTTSILREQVDKLNKPIGLQIAQFPNMPDGAVIDTNAESPNDPPSMFPREVGALASASAFLGEGNEYEVSAGGVASGSIRSSTDPTAFLTTLQTGGEAPLVMTPAAVSGETWQLLPSNGNRALPPAVSTATFSDWGLAAGTSGPGLPEWNGTTLKPEAGQNPLDGPLPDLYSSARPSSGQTKGQWMIEKSGMSAGLLTASGTGFGSASGAFAWYLPSGTDGKEPGLGFASCTPSGDEECTLPSWQSLTVNPFSQVTAGQTYNSGSEELNTGLFDLNNGLVISNQQGHQADQAAGFYEAYASNPGAFLNQYPNWTNSLSLRGVGYYGYLETLNGSGGSNSLQPAGWSKEGRPVLFTRPQAANDCFYWTPSGSGSAYGSGCLRPRVHSGEILP